MFIKPNQTNLLFLITIKQHALCLRSCYGNRQNAAVIGWKRSDPDANPFRFP